MSQTDSFYLPNSSGAAFRALLNRILEALSEQNAGSTEPSDPFPGMLWLDTSSKPNVLKIRNDANTGWDGVFTEQNPPSKVQVGLGNVPNYAATSSISDGSTAKLLLAKAAKDLNDQKLGKGDAAADASKLGGVAAASYARTTGTYAGLRAQATTKADVDLGSVQNYGITSSLTSNNSQLYLSAKAGYDLNQTKVSKTLKINGITLQKDFNLTAANVGAVATNGGNLNGTLNYLPDTGTILALDGKPALRRITLQGGLSLGCDDSVIIACGEARNTLETNVDLSGGGEELYLGSDNTMQVITNVQSGWANRKISVFEVDGGFKPANPAKTRANLGAASTDDVGRLSFMHDYLRMDGTSGNWTTSQFKTWLKTQGAFANPCYWVARGVWSYASSKTITDTGCGNIHLAGAVVEVIGRENNHTIRITTPTTSTNGGVINAEFIYVFNGDDYLPGWRVNYGFNKVGANIASTATSGAFTVTPGATGRVLITLHYSTMASYGAFGITSLTVSCGGTSKTAQSRMMEYQDRRSAADMSVSMIVNVSAATTCNWSTLGTRELRNLNGCWVGI